MNSEDRHLDARHAAVPQLQMKTIRSPRGVETAPVRTITKTLFAHAVVQKVTPKPRGWLRNGSTRVRSVRTIGLIK